MTIEVTLAEATAIYKALEQKIAQLRPDPDGYVRLQVARLERIEQKIEDAILAE